MFEIPLHFVFYPLTRHFRIFLLCFDFTVPQTFDFPKSFEFRCPCFLWISIVQFLLNFDSNCNFKVPFTFRFTYASNFRCLFSLWISTLKLRLQFGVYCFVYTPILKFLSIYISHFSIFIWNLNLYFDCKALLHVIM